MFKICPPVQTEKNEIILAPKKKVNIWDISQKKKIIYPSNEAAVTESREY
jgi:hypothetical protein